MNNLKKEKYSFLEWYMEEEIIYTKHTIIMMIKEGKNEFSN
jgi:hypothetical protein